MPFTRSNQAPRLGMDDDRYLSQQLSPQSRQMDLFSKSSDAMPGNWNYDSTLDLFSLTSTDMDPVSFDFNDGLADADKDLFMDPFGTPSSINGFIMPITDDAVSPASDFSDDQSWSGLRQSFDLSTPEQTSSTTTETPKISTRASSKSSTRWSSSPEIKPQESQSQSSQAGKSTRKTRSLSQESSHSGDQQGRNAAKRAAHNIIEKRYRTNMNSKFLSLEKAISPASVHKQSSRVGAGSLKKSEILSNALAYIEAIQTENQSMHKELSVLKQNMLPMWRQKQSRG
ncbi:hypothetical protein N7478_011765 [Penicillium angulare]|uniref:uncharacterized protein n=1 Tax=Penicillium angulare TaxID=116970 RepID=UPI00253F78E2|nr:uncharacterized protein N7478_011765 [Penicillium angulare]KAJ5261170.1 hypothetical protein N7478_011765 [Penicillium angulare]